MLLWSLLSVASASLPCADVPAQVQVAWDAYNEAELEKAKSLLAQAYANLACQYAVVPAEALLELYRLDALVSLTQEDRKSAVYATIRAVAVDHEEAEPPPEYGPELAELYDTWSARLAETLVTVTVADGGTAWVDGRRVTHDAPLRVVQGEHLLQIEGAAGITSEVRELSVDLPVTTGVPLVVSEPIAKPVAKPEPVVKPEPVRERKRRHPAGLLVTGGLGTAAGAAAIFWGWRSEGIFNANDYKAPGYDGCSRASACYAAARQGKIEADALTVRMFYVGGYGITGVGVGLLGLGIVGLPVRTDGRTVSIDLRW